MTTTSPCLFRIIALCLATITQFATNSAQASDKRFTMDPTLKPRLAELAAKGEILSKSDHIDDTFTVDASAVFKGRADLLLRKAAEYDRFVQMGMPHLDQSTVVERSSPEMIFVFSTMSYLMLSSSQYMAVRVTPGTGVDWEMTPQRANWPMRTSSLFSRSEGSFYAEDLPDGRVYVRYYMRNDLDIPLSGLLGGLIRSALESGAVDVIKVLAHEAGFQQ